MLALRRGCLRLTHDGRSLARETARREAPDDFIPVAEDTGMIVPLGAWVLHEACRDAMGWPASSALRGSGLPAARLDIEITKTVLLQPSEATLAVLRELRGMGISISLDDFGTGYSSLAYLRNFRFDRIKIDRSFVGDLLQRADSEAIVRAVIGIGNTLGIATVAEGEAETGGRRGDHARGVSRRRLSRRLRVAA